MSRLRMLGLRAFRIVGHYFVDIVVNLFWKDFIWNYYGLDVRHKVCICEEIVFVFLSFILVFT